MTATRTLLPSPVFEIGDYWVLPAVFGSGRVHPRSKGFQVWKHGATHATPVAHIGYSGEEGLEKAKAEATRRHNEDSKVRA